MTSFDGLLEARSKQVADVVRRSYSRPMAGSDRSTRETTLGEKGLAVLGIAEELLTKTVGNLVSDNPKYDWRNGVGSYHTQTGFADLFRDTGMDPTTAAMLGIAAAIVNPLDPLNKIKILGTTKLGKAAEGVELAGDLLKKGSDDLYRVAKSDIENAIKAKTKEIESGALVGDNVERAKRSISQMSEQLKHTDELNALLVELQQRNVSVKDLKVAGSTFDAIRTGQKHLIGFSDPRKLDQLSLFGIGKGYTDSASAYGLSGSKTAALVKSVTGIKNKIVKPLGEGAYKLADMIGIPTIRGERMTALSAKIKANLDIAKAGTEEFERDLLSIYKQHVDSYGVDGAEAAKTDLLTVLQNIETRNNGVKQLAIEAIGKLNDYKTPSLPRGKGVAVESGSGLTNEQKLRLTASGIEDADIPVAIGQFDQAHSPSIFTGTRKQFEVKTLGKFVVVKTNVPINSADKLSELDGIFGNRVWASHEKNGSTYLVQKRHPGAARLVNANQFHPEHLRNLESIAAQLSAKKKGFASLSPEDILVSPSGAIQIVNPSAITDFKSAKQAVANSRQAIETFADDIGSPKGSWRELSKLKNTVTARSVPRGVDGLTFRSAAATDIGPGVLHVPANDLLEQAVNTDGYKQYVRASYDQVEPQALAEMVGDSVEFERANNIDFHRKRIREAIARGETPQIEPIAIVKDDLGNLHIVNGRDRLTASILEGYEAVPVYERNFIGEAANVEAGFYRGSTVKLTDLWHPHEDSSAANVLASTRGLVASNYTLIQRNGETLKLGSAQLTHLDSRLSALLNRLLTAGPIHSVGKARTQRLDSAAALLKENFGSARNALIALSEMAENSADLQSFVTKFESVLVNQKTGQGIRLDNTLRHPDSEAIFAELRDAGSKTLDSLAVAGVFTNGTVSDARRLALATDKSDLVVKVLDAQTNTLRVYSNQATTSHLQSVAEGWINKTVQAADVEPYARIQLNGVDGTTQFEVKDLVKDGHPKIVEVLHNQSVFVISKEMGNALKKQGIFVADGKNTGEINEALSSRGLTQFKNSGGVLLADKEVAAKSTTTGKYVQGRKENVLVRPEFTFFVTRSGAVVVGTKQRNVKDLIETVFEEGPAYFEEFGVMTTGKIVVSNPFGSKMQKIGLGEVGVLKERIQLLAKRFKELGFSDGTVMDIKVPFDDAVWRSMYGERVTIGDLLDDKFKLTIPENLKGYVPDIRVIAPARVGTQGEDLGVVGMEKTRLANEKLQKLFDRLVDLGDELFLKQAKEGLPINYYSSWFGRHLTQATKEAINEAWLKFPDKESKTFKYFESAFKGRTLTDLTTQEVNSVIKRIQKEGEANAETIIAEVVAKYRDGYKLNPTKETAAILNSLAKVTPEGLDFFYHDPIWSLALSSRGAQRAIARTKIVDSIKESGVTVWNGSVEELNALKMGKNKKFLEHENTIGQLNAELTKTQKDLEQLAQLTPDIAVTTRKAELEKQIDSLVQQLAKANEAKVSFIERAGKGKVMDTMVDLESEQVWIRGEDMQRMVEDGVLKHTDVIGDPSDAFVRVPIKKYASELDANKAEIFLFPKEVAPVVQRYFGTTTKDGFNKFLAFWDTMHATWRAWTLFPVPAYHTRNFIGNLFQAYIGGVSDPRAYQESMALMNIIDAHRKGSLTTKQVSEALSTINIATASGKVYTGQEIYNAFVQHGGLSGGLHYNEFTAFGSVARQSEFEKLSIKAGLRPSSELAGSVLIDNAALRGGVAASAYVENRMRLAAFMDSLVKGHVEQKNGITLLGTEAAAMRMKSIYYDYGDLSAFERSWLRRIIPFYSWSRHNIPRMLETLMTDPVKHYRMAEFFHSVETGAVGGPRDENTIPEWMKSRFGLIVEKTPEGKYIMKTGDGFLPMIDAYKLLAGGDIVRMVKDGMTPFVKVPIEQLLNYSMYSDRPIEQVPGQRAQSFTLGGLGFSRRATTEGPLGVLNLLLNESLLKTFFRPGGELATKIIDPIFDGKEGPSIKLGIYALMVGKFYEIDPQQARLAIYSNWSRHRKQLLSLRNQAVEQGDIKSVEDADRMMGWLAMQYPGDKEL